MAFEFNFNNVKSYGGNFSSAFNAARNAGEKFFKWNGKVYNTVSKEDLVEVQPQTNIDVSGMTQDQLDKEAQMYSLARNYQEQNTNGDVSNYILSKYGNEGLKHFDRYTPGIAAGAYKAEDDAMAGVSQSVPASPVQRVIDDPKKLAGELANSYLRKDANNRGDLSEKMQFLFDGMKDNPVVQDYMNSTYKNKDGKWNVEAWKKDFGRRMGKRNMREFVMNAAGWADAKADRENRYAPAQGATTPAPATSPSMPVAPAATPAPADNSTSANQSWYKPGMSKDEFIKGAMNFNDKIEQYKQSYTPKYQVGGSLAMNPEMQEKKEAAKSIIAEIEKMDDSSRAAFDRSFAEFCNKSEISDEMLQNEDILAEALVAFVDEQNKKAEAQRMRIGGKINYLAQLRRFK